MENNWTLIKADAYKNDISNSIELEKVMSSYSNETMNLDGLHTFINKVCTMHTHNYYLNSSIKDIIFL